LVGIEPLGSATLGDCEHAVSKRAIPAEVMAILKNFILLFLVVNTLKIASIAYGEH
jgi:hypothetical protein